MYDVIRSHLFVNRAFVPARAARLENRIPHYAIYSTRCLSFHGILENFQYYFSNISVLFITFVY